MYWIHGLTLTRLETKHGHGFYDKDELQKEFNPNWCFQIAWEEIKPWPSEIETFIERVYSFKERLYSRFKKGAKEEVVLKERDRAEPGDELTRELEDAWYMYTRVST